MELFLGFALLVCIDVLVGVQLRSLSHKGFKGPMVKGFVGNRGWKVQRCFRSDHLKRKKGMEKTRV